MSISQKYYKIIIYKLISVILFFMSLLFFLRLLVINANFKYKAYINNKSDIIFVYKRNLFLVIII